MITQPKKLAAGALCLVLGLLGSACSYTNSEGDQDGAPIKILNTNPTGCTLTLVERGLVLKTPAQLSEDVDEDEILRVEKEGFASWEGTLESLQRSGFRTYELELRPLR